MRRAPFLFLLLFGVFGLTNEADAALRWLTLSLTPNGKHVFALTRTTPNAFQRLQASQRILRTTIWIRRTNGWVRYSAFESSTRERTLTLSLRRMCFQAPSHAQAVLQVAIRRGSLWWHRWNRRWQRNYIALHQVSTWLSCRPLDLPPGSPPTGQGTQPPPLTVLGPAPQPQPHPTAPSQPPPQLVVPKHLAFSFLRALRREIYDRNRIKLLKSWVERLRGYRVRSKHITRYIKTFSSSTTRWKAARLLQPHIKQPVRIRHIIRIIRPFIYENTKRKVAILYCKGIIDPLNIHRLTAKFTYSASKQAILNQCK